MKAKLRIGAKNLFLLLLPIFLILSQQCYSQSNVCAECKTLLSNGLRDEYKTKANVSIFNDSKAYFSSDNFEKDYSDGKWNGGISALVDGETIGLTGGSSTDQIHAFQKSIRKANSVIINDQTYNTLSKSTLNVEIANAYVNCVTSCPDYYGPKISLKGSDDDNIVSVTVNYKTLGTDMYPNISSIDAEGITKADFAKIQGLLKKGNRITPSISFSITRIPTKDLLIAINTSNGTSTIARLESSSDASNNGISPVGTIICSVLDFETFSKLTKNNPSGSWSFKSKWAPCDGRSVVGSRYQIQAGSIGGNVPDLRGVFLRGLNQFAFDETHAVDSSQANPENKKKNEFQSDAIKSHQHNSYYPTTLGLAFSDLHDNLQMIQGINGKTLLPTSTDAINSRETRPKNVSVFYYIRIN
jgi:hypothetical protein